MDNHLIEDRATNDSRQQQMQEDACLCLQIHNFIDSEIISLINHYELV